MKRVFLTGNLGKDAELKQGKSGKPYLSFSVANTERNYDGSKETEWVNCTMSGGEKLAPYLTKGSKVALYGRESIRVSEEDNIPVVFLNVSEIELLGGQEQKREAAPKQHSGKMLRAKKVMKDAGFEETNDEPF
ncbi:MAG: single-stranded DNA-binding protein [Bacteroidaceae bacterium]|nr:single-stranded DNA-binding protein [Bacteroidaceae bacterium]